MVVSPPGKCLPGTVKANAVKHVWFSPSIAILYIPVLREAILAACLALACARAFIWRSC